MQVVHRITGTLTPCASCKGQPKHIEQRGRERHWLECCPCGTRTAPSATLNEAVEAWEQQGALRTAA
jgi:hypothetical protein